MFPIRLAARALAISVSRGFMKSIADAGTDKTLGASVLGIEAGELMSALQIAMMSRLPYTALRDALFAHPTLLESLNKVFGSSDNPKAHDCLPD